MKRIVVRFYRTDSGSEPVRDWLLTLDKSDKLAIGEDIKTLEFGWPKGMPVCKALGSGLYEVRSHLSAGRISRVLFCIMDNNMILLHAFIKKTQKTPEKELDLARTRKRSLK